jgi:antibiotic biosynthesis monooxygenase (ABM) superfamily enzyme
VDNKRVLLVPYTLRKMRSRRDAPGHSWRDSHTRESWRKLVSRLCYGEEDRHQKKVAFFSFENQMVAILNFIINQSLYNLSNHFNEFLDPKNIGFDIKIIALC